MYGIYDPRDSCIVIGLLLHHIITISLAQVVGRLIVIDGCLRRYIHLLDTLI